MIWVSHCLDPVVSLRPQSSNNLAEAEGVELELAPETQATGW